MKQGEKVRQITKKEAKEIDPTKVAYFTLSDGTVFIVKDNINQGKQPDQVQITSENGYNVSSEGENIQQISGVNMNAQLINAQAVSPSQIVGHKRQLYKLIEAVPVRFLDVQGVQFMNQSDNTQINLQQYNNDTYIVEKSNRDTSSNNQVNTQSEGKLGYCNCAEKKEEMTCCCPIGNPKMREEMEIVSPEIAKKYEEYLEKEKVIKNK